MVHTCTTLAKIIQHYYKYVPWYLFEIFLRVSFIPGIIAEIGSIEIVCNKIYLSIFMDQKSISFRFHFAAFFPIFFSSLSHMFIWNWAKKKTKNFHDDENTNNITTTSIGRSIFIQLSNEFNVCQLESILYELHTVGRQSISRNNFIW